MNSRLVRINLKSNGKLTKTKILETLEKFLVEQNGYALINLKAVERELGRRTIKISQNSKTLEALREIARKLGYRYIIMMRAKSAHYTIKKIYLFRDLSHDMAQALLERKAVCKVIEV